MNDLITFLAARLDEDEAAAASWAGPPSLRARQRREVEAKRAIMAAWEEPNPAEGPEYFFGLLVAIRFHAAVYSGHPDYRAEWKP